MYYPLVGPNSQGMEETRLAKRWLSVQGCKVALLFIDVPTAVYRSCILAFLFHNNLFLQFINIKKW